MAVSGDLMDDDSRLPAKVLGRMWRMAGAGLAARRALRSDDIRLEEWVASIGRLKGIAMKMGQIMSYIDVAIPPEAQRALAALQTASSSMRFDQVQRIVEDEVGAAAKAWDVEPEPVAAASIGQVHRATLPDSGRVAVKVQFPEVEQAIRSDFRLAGIAPSMARMLAPTADVRPLIAEAQRQFLLECDYTHEAEAQRRLRSLHEDDPDIVIPEVHGVSTRRVLVTEWIDGAGLEAYLAQGPTQAARDRAGQAIHRFYVGSLLRFGIYNGDPHPGNQLYLDDGRVAILDHGCTRTFDPETVQNLARLALAVHDGDEEGLDAAIRRIGIAQDGARLDDARRFMHAFYSPFAADGGVQTGAGKDMGQILADKRRLMRMHLPGEFLFLLRIRFGLASVLARLDARGDWAAAESAWARAALAGQDRSAHGS